MPEQTSLIGLSLSFCVRDIASGKVKLKDIQVIITGTKARTPEHWNDIITHYKEIYWRENPELCEQITRDLISRNMIDQPRLRGMAPSLAAGIHWVNTSTEIEWVAM